MTPIIIGAGGVASYMLPVLLKMFRPEIAWLFDADTLEERNLDRQQFNAKYVGHNKAEALVKTIGASKLVKVIPNYFTADSEIPRKADTVICIADNHLARKAALEVADAKFLPCVIGGNEYFDSEAYIYLSRWKGTKADPRVRYPDILTDRAGSPLVSCTGEAQKASPQLALANQRCATQILSLIYILEELTGDKAANYPIELSTSKYGSRNLLLKDVL